MLCPEQNMILNIFCVVANRSTSRRHEPPEPAGDPVENIRLSDLRLRTTHARDHGCMAEMVRLDRRQRRRDGALPARTRDLEAGISDLPLGPDAITGFLIVEAPSFEDAERMAQSNPYISSIRVY